uniref:Uncharacterized protein n=1 Tax=Oryza meridionalis TaxID=40149 RepID=A0A0E0CB33_9ORYZ
MWGRHTKEQGEKSLFIGPSRPDKPRRFASLHPFSLLIRYAFPPCRYPTPPSSPGLPPPLVRLVSNTAAATRRRDLSNPTHFLSVGARRASCPQIRRPPQLSYED